MHLRTAKMINVMNASVGVIIEENQDSVLISSTVDWKKLRRERECFRLPL